MSGIVMVSEALKESEESIVELEAVDMFKATSGPAEIYEPVQTFHIWQDEDQWAVLTEDERYLYVKELYCNVPTATSTHPKAESPYQFCMVATGRLTISGGVAYVDVG